jgi:hypothetical protein
MANRDKRTNFGLYISFHRTKQIRSIIHQLGRNATLIKIKKNVQDAIQRVCLSTIVYDLENPIYLRYCIT